MPQTCCFTQTSLSTIKSLKTIGIEDFGESQITISVYPNPSTSVFNVRLSETNQDVKWEVVNVHGAEIANGDFQQNPFTFPTIQKEFTI